MAPAREIPSEMRAAAIDQFGSPEAVHTEIVPVPKLGKKDVLVRVAYAGVGEWDPDIVGGSFQDVEVRFPRVLGSDGAGTIVAIGSRVERFAVGDRVYGWGVGNRKGGFFAEYAAVNERDIAPIPDRLTFEEAGALAVSGITALQGLEQLHLSPGQSVIIIGASGGVGHVAVQLAKRLGLRVFAVASKTDGVQLVRQLGADEVADGHRRSLVRDMCAFAPDGFDGALVLAGANGWPEELALVRKGGRIAWPNGVEPIPEVPAGVKATPYDGHDSPAAFTRLNELIARGPFHIELAKVYPLDAAAKALEDVQRHHVGKLAIEVTHVGKRTGRRGRSDRTR